MSITNFVFSKEFSTSLGHLWIRMGHGVCQTKENHPIGWFHQIPSFSLMADFRNFVFCIFGSSFSLS